MISAEMLSNLSKTSLLIAIISFFIALFFWFKFKILFIISSLSKSSHKKFIKNLREEAKNFNRARSSIDTNNSSIQDFSKNNLSVSNAIEGISTVLPDNSSAGTEEETVLLSQIQNANKTGKNNQIFQENSTSLLLDTEVTEDLSKKTHEDQGLIMLEDVLLVYSRETI